MKIFLRRVTDRLLFLSLKMQAQNLRRTWRRRPLLRKAPRQKEKLPPAALLRQANPVLPMTLLRQTVPALPMAPHLQAAPAKPAPYPAMTTAAAFRTGTGTHLPGSPKAAPMMRIRLRR